MPTTRALYLLDLNVLLSLTWPQHVHHLRAHAWFDDLAPARWATTPVTESGFVRLSMNAAVVSRPVLATEALDVLTDLRAWPNHTFMPDDASMTTPNIGLTRFATSRQVTDLHLVNLAAKHGAVLATLDRAIPDYLEPDDRRFVVVLP